MTLKTIIEVLREACKITEKKKRDKIDSNELTAIAKAFNDRYTYRFIYTGAQKHAWMCSKCNRVHISCGFSAFTGVEFPACCQTPFGDRLHQGIRIL